jgi:hypothetical protein
MGVPRAASFSDGVRGRLYFCEAVFIIFYFDENDRLVMYHRRLLGAVLAGNILTPDIKFEPQH